MFFFCFACVFAFPLRIFGVKGEGSVVELEEEVVSVYEGGEGFVCARACLCLWVCVRNDVFTSSARAVERLGQDKEGCVWTDGVVFFEDTRARTDGGGNGGELIKDSMPLTTCETCCIVCTCNDEKEEGEEEI